jgi:uncharacterized membrane protein
VNEDQGGALLAGALLSLASIGAWRVVVAAATGRIRANSALGLRTPATVASEAGWEEAHRAALPVIRPFCIAAVVAGLAGAAMGSWPPVGVILVLSSAALLVSGTVGGAIAGHRAARLMHPR